MNDVYRAMLADIIDCRLKPGETYRVSELVKQYQSRSDVLHEAIASLEDRNLLECHAKDDVIISKIEPASVSALFEIRIPAEKMAASLAAQRVQRRHLRGLAELELEMHIAVAANDLEAYIGIDQNIHDAVIDAAGNPILKHSLKVLRQHAIRLWRFFQDRNIRENTDEANLGALIRAIENRDSRSAAKAMHRHLQNSLDAFEEMLARSNCTPQNEQNR